MDTSTDAGLRSFMLGVYNKLALGILLAGVLAYAAGTWAPLTELIFNTPLYYVVQFGPIALLLGSMFFMKNPSPLGSAILYWSIVTMIGLGLGIWVLMAGHSTGSVTRAGTSLAPTYTTIAQAFLLTASAFGGLSLFGYTMKRNITGMGTFMFMAIWGVVGMSVISMFLPPSSMFEWIIMGAVFLLSAGIIVWQTQALKVGYYQLGGDQRGMAVMTNWGALNFFISFINMFRIVMMLLSRD
ncbi:MAG: Bax inhibitor-1/YccA family protein [Hyphomonadaceae bacterium]